MEMIIPPQIGNQVSLHGNGKIHGNPDIHMKCPFKANLTVFLFFSHHCMGHSLSIYQKPPALPPYNVITLVSIWDSFAGRFFDIWWIDAEWPLCQNSLGEILGGKLPHVTCCVALKWVVEAYTGSSRFVHLFVRPWEQFCLEFFPKPLGSFW